MSYSPMAAEPADTAFPVLQTEVLSHYGAGRHEEALALARSALLRHHDRRARISFWIACLECLMGRREQALATLSGLVDQGEWFNPDRLKDDADLAPLRAHPEFEALVQICLERRDSEQTRLRRRLLLEPPGAVDERLPPLLMALHMTGGDQLESLHHWRPATSAGALVAAPQGDRLMGPGEFAWSDGPAADLGDHLREIEGRHPFDANRIVLAGASGGAVRAVSTALEGEPFVSRGFIAVVGAPRPEAVEERLHAAKRNGVRGVFITGERDPIRPRVEAVYALLSEAGLAVSIEVVPKLGHEYPPNLDSLIADALRFVLT